MNDGWKPRILSERGGRWLLNLYPPFLFNRIRITEIGKDYRRIRVRVSRSLLTRNLNGTTFGGTIFSAADPMYSVMYWQIFARRGERVQVWLRSATIRYRKPAASRLTLDFSLDEAEILDAVGILDREGTFVRTYRTEALDREGETCAVIETEIYLRRARMDQEPVSAF